MLIPSAPDEKLLAIHKANYHQAKIIAQHATAAREAMGGLLSTAKTALISAVPVAVSCGCTHPFDLGKYDFAAEAAQNVALFDSAWKAMDYFCDKADERVRVCEEKLEAFKGELADGNTG
jgi:hypothetical protein